MAAVKTSTTELGDSRVRVDVEVAADDVERQLRTAAAEVGRDMRLPGFRKGKVPAEVVLQRVGRDAVLDDAVRRALPGWYEQAITDARVVTVGEPQLDLSDLPEKGAPLGFSIEVAVRPIATLGDYGGLEVGRREPTVDSERVDTEIVRLRESLASLDTVEREAGDGDFVVLDFVGTVDDEPFEGGEARGYLLELGSGRLIPGFEEQLAGATAGEERAVEVTFPDDYAEHLAGQSATFDVTVKEVKEKRLPDLDDDFASDAGGFDSLAELRSDIESRVREADDQAIEAEFREAVVDAVAAEAEIPVTDDLVQAKARELWSRTAHRLSHQGIEPEQYLQFTGKTEDELIEEAKPDAERALRREATLAAVVEAEAIEVSGDELFDSLREASGMPAGEELRPSDEKKLRKALKQLSSDGRDDLLREDIAMRKAVDLLVERATPIPAEAAEARDKLWTPDKEKSEKPELWTPGS
ncbi:MAG: trigger factor [Thermoleophilaceae bacterium]